MKTKLLFLFITSLLFSCSNSNLKLDDDIIVTSIYDSKEIKELRDIIDIFDTELKTNYKTSDTPEAYHTFLESLRYNEDIDELYEKMDLLQPAVDSALLKLKNSKLFEETFVKTYGFKLHTNQQDTLTSMILPLWDGKYYKFLDNLSRYDKRFIDYKESVEASGGIPPSLLIAFPLIHKDFDLNKESNRLAVVFHYLILLSSKDYK